MIAHSPFAMSKVSASSWLFVALQVQLLLRLEGINDEESGTVDMASVLELDREERSGRAATQCRQAGGTISANIVEENAAGGGGTNGDDLVTLN